MPSIGISITINDNTFDEERSKGSVFIYDGGSVFAPALVITKDTTNEIREEVNEVVNRLIDLYDKKK